MSKINLKQKAIRKLLGQYLERTLRACYNISNDKEVLTFEEYCKSVNLELQIMNSKGE